MNRMLVTSIVGLTLAIGSSNSAELIENEQAFPQKMFLRGGWAIQSSDKVKEDGGTISTGKFRPNGWYPTSVPSTVLAALCKNGVGPDPYFCEYLRKLPGYQDGIW